MRPPKTPPRDPSGVRSLADADRPSQTTRPAGEHVRSVADGPDRRLAAIAARASGIVDLRDTDAAGLSRRAVSRRVAAGRLHRIHLGVFAVGHPGLEPRAAAVAALRAGGPSALLTHASSAALWGLGPWPPFPHLTLSTRRRLSGVITHRSAALPPRVWREGLPTTSAPRMLLDIAEVGDEETVSRILNEALYRRLVTPAELHRMTARAPGRRGLRLLTSLLPDAEPLHSPLEDAFFALLTAARLPRPLANVRVADHQADFWWPAPRVVVETDGWGAHGTRLRFETDRERDADLLAAGIRVMRITRHALRTRPHAVTARLGAVLLGRP